jgi:hypothetical protein
MTHHLLDVSRMIDKLLDSRTSNPVRLDTALEIAELSEAVPNIHEEFLLLTTVARWASRRNHRQLAGMVAERYRFKSKAFTGGRTDDALGVGKDLPALEFGHSSDEVESGT